MPRLQAQVGLAGRDRRRLVFAFLLATAVAVYFAFDQWHRREVIIDDAFISYRYAQNLVAGNGLVFNPGERVEGYTNFLWVLVAAVALAFEQDPLRLTVFLGVATFLASLVVCSAVAFFANRGRLLPALTAGLCAWLFVLPKGFASLAGSGLETSFLGFVLLGMGVLNHLWLAKNRLWTAVAMVLPLLALLTRLDAALGVGVSGIVFFFQNRAGGTWSSAVRATLLRFGPSFVGLVAFLLWKQNYYGAFLPNTYWAKGADFVPVTVGVKYVVGFIRHAPWVPFLGPMAVYAAFSAPRRVRVFARFALLTCVLHTAYVIKVGGDFMQYRFMWEVAPLYIAAAMVGLRELPAPGVAAVVAALALPLATTESFYEHVHEMHEPMKMDAYTRSGIRVGKALAELPADTVIATTLAGTVGYYSRLPLVDQWGLNDKYVARLPIQTFTGRGHLKRAPQSYLEQRGVNLLVDYPAICSCSEPCVENVPNAFFRIGNGECVRTWYMTQTPALTDALCKPRSDVILHNVQCPGELTMRNAKPPATKRSVHRLVPMTAPIVDLARRKP